MGKFSLENKIKERLQGHEVHVDKQELWKALGIEEEEKDRKGIWFWWFAEIVGLVLIIGMWWYFQSDNFDQPTVQETALVEIDENIAKTGNETLDKNTTTEQLAAIIDDVESQSDDVKETSSRRSSNAISKQNKDNSASRRSQGNGLTTQNTLVTESKTTIDNSAAQANRALSGTNENSIASKSAALNSELRIDLLENIQPFLLFDRNLKGLSLDVQPLIQPLPKPRKFELEFFGGVGTISRTLSNNNQDSIGRELDNYLVDRDSSESTLEHISLGVSLKYIIGGGFYGKAGLTFNRWNEKYTYNLVSDTTMNPVEIPDVILFDLAGNSTTQYTEGFQTIYNSIDWVRYNRLTQIDLPITLGYEHRIQRWSLFGEATGIFNLRQTFSGYLNTNEGIATKNPEIFKTNIGFNLGLNAGIGYGITPRLRARLSARYYRSLGSVLLESTGIEQKYTSVGARLGIGYLF